ncbi:MAG: tRNA lysidine(34) synthetase TilS [Rudaea sp.]|uniref:tRNA lysidine(34) synthetase TilS n=1 Tax=Rudaea sp. TaxID=2136325 RepID=UPI0039E415F2
MPLSSIRAHLDRALAALPPGALVVGCSGGADSSVLLHALAQVPDARARGLRAVHIEHGLHADSAAWSGHCRETAARLSVPIDVIRVEVARGRGSGLEDAARRARMAAFERTLRPGEILVLAHHRDDQAETVLLKLLRGAGPEGLGGMRVLRAFGAGYLWRPLLELSRSALRDHARDHGLQWLDDPSNADTTLRRNFLRAEILPRLAARWPDADAALAHSAAWARHAADFIDAEARKALARVRGAAPDTLAWRDWLALPDALRDLVLRRWLRELGLDEPAHFHVAELERQLRDASEDRLPCVRFGDTELRRHRGLLHALRPLPPLPRDWQAEWDGAAALALPGGDTLALEPARRLDPPLLVRHRRGGERIKPAGAAHTRELRLLLQEADVPPWRRERIPLVFREDALLAVGDLFVSDDGAALGLRWNRAPA